VRPPGSAPSEFATGEAPEPLGELPLPAGNDKRNRRICDPGAVSDSHLGLVTDFGRQGLARWTGNVWELLEVPEGPLVLAGGLPQGLIVYPPQGDRVPHLRTSGGTLKPLVPENSTLAEDVRLAGAGVVATSRSSADLAVWREGDWRVLRDVPLQRFTDHLVLDDGSVLVLGQASWDGSPSAPQVDTLAVSSGEGWTRHALPDGLAAPAGPLFVQTVTDAVVLRGRTSGPEATEGLWRFMPEEGRFVATELPEPPWDPAVRRGPDGALHLAGGSVGLRGPASDAHWVLAEGEVSWRPATPLRTPRRCGSLVVHDGDLILLGGTGVDGTVASVERLALLPQ